MQPKFFQKRFELNPHELNIEAIATDSSENLILTCSRDQHIKLYQFPEDLKNGLMIRQDFTHHKSSVINLKAIPFFHKPSFFVSLSTDETIKFWDFEEKKCIKTLNLKGSVSSFLIEDSKIFAAFGRESIYYIKILDLYGGETLQELKGHSDVILSMAIHHKMNLLISASRDKSICFWNLKSKKSFQKPLSIYPKAHKLGITNILLIESKNLLISGSNDHLIKIWFLKEDLSLTLSKTLAMHKGWILSLYALSEDIILSSAADDQIRMWNVNTGECLDVINDEMFNPGSLIFIRSKKTLLVGDKNGKLIGWELCGPLPLNF